MDGVVGLGLDRCLGLGLGLGLDRCLGLGLGLHGVFFFNEWAQSGTQARLVRGDYFLRFHTPVSIVGLAR